MTIGHQNLYIYSTNDFLFGHTIICSTCERVNDEINPVDTDNIKKLRSYLG